MVYSYRMAFETHKEGDYGLVRQIWFIRDKLHPCITADLPFHVVEFHSGPMR
jgi:hypothetical protein